MACPARGSWWIGWGMQPSALVVGVMPASARAAFELVLAVALGLAFLGVLVAIVVTAYDVVGNNHAVEAYRAERRNRLSVIRRLEAEGTRTDDVAATLADLARFFDGPVRSEKSAGIDVAVAGTTNPATAGSGDEQDRQILGEGNRR